MRVGAVVMLNGTSRAGKSTVARACQHVMEEPYLHTGLDHFLARFPRRFMDEVDGWGDIAPFIALRSPVGSAPSTGPPRQSFESARAWRTKRASARRGRRAVWGPPVGARPNAYRHVVAALTVSPLWLPVHRSAGSTGYNVRQRRAPAPYLQTGLPRGRQRGGRGDARASGAQRDSASPAGRPRGETETHTE